ncbi:BhlA/UviB family holin-like peptide [Clostridium formicaceticum]|uniref:Bacteriocin n=1 Tax=Clostridium formicaceticum TaxID=1497 RepID=A0AAC9RKT3_9CLOT|nr:BhlA/UviB family holin-like peptide [Clostridium formicaceticum]AOY76928.1 bacteriocin [Clostridium formicaceticum]ARE87407.1 Bacteriocin UviB precursor [Clostridium formicaceticum]
MENEIMRYMIGQGAFAALFVYLLFYVLRENSKREGKYQEIIQELTSKFNIIEDVKSDVKEIKNKIFK